MVWTVPRFQGRNQGIASLLKGRPCLHRKGTTLHPSFRPIICYVLTRVGQNFYREAVLWKQFRHPNLLPLVGATKSSDTPMMVSEWMENGTIMNFVTACPQTNRLKLVGIFIET